MPHFEKSKWIWADCEVCDDMYTEYLESIPQGDGEAMLRISCDSDYELYINGIFVSSNQYGDFEHYKIYDTVDISRFLSAQSNEIKFIVYYCGVNTSRYRRGEAGLIYEITRNGECIAWSDMDTLSRVSPAYISGRKKWISGQLGFSFTYDATKITEGGYSKSVCVNKKATLYPRPIKKLSVLPALKVKSVTKESFGYMIDLGRETVGFATLDFESSHEGWITVAYGESLDDGRVRKNIGPRDFSFEYKAKKGRNVFANHMLRLACRYIEVICDEEIAINQITLLPQVYEVSGNLRELDSELDRRIYDICENTLRLCMMEHYVDTPWREECLYAFDSRNQMLCGYYAFSDGNKDYARANLKLIGEDRRDDELLSICYPCGVDLTIPSFSLYYVIAMKEYITYTKDATLAKEYLWKMESICNAFLKNMSDGLIAKFGGAQNWNFYDWSPYLSGTLGHDEPTMPDLVINCLFVLALDSLESICKEVCEPFKYSGVADSLRKRIYAQFMSENGLLSHHKNSGEYTELGNSLAVLCRVVTGDEAAYICESIVAGKTTQSSLSMKIWKYDAMLMTDKEKYAEYILGEIRSNYEKMLNAGSTTVWETEEGSRGFGNAGSLCHGWSAVPMYIYHYLGMVSEPLCESDLG